MKDNRMKEINYLFFALLAIILMGCNSASGLDYLLETYPATSEAQCQGKDGYWYKEKCWANFNDLDDSIAASEIDAEVEEQLTKAKEFELVLNGKEHDLYLFLPQPDEQKDKLTFISLFIKDGKTQTLLQLAPSNAMSKDEFAVQSVLFDTNLITLSKDKAVDADSYIIAKGEATVIRTGNDEESMVLLFEGTLTSKKDRVVMPYTLEAGMVLLGLGSTTLEVKGEEAYLNGVLGTKSYRQFKDLIKNHPEVKTIVLEDVPGSMNDMVNMHTGRLIKSAGLTTKILAYSKIASGGVDLFCSGKKRIVTKGAKVGVHSWSGGDFTAIQLPKDHPAHQYQIAYFNEIMGAPRGEAFYFYTLEAAPFDSVHWMSIDEIQKWNVATQIVNK